MPRQRPPQPADRPAARKAPLTPEQRVLRARYAAHVLHSKYDSRELTAPARDARWQRLLDAVDPLGVLPLAERERRADQRRRAEMAHLAYLSSRARAKRRKRPS